MYQFKKGDRVEYTGNATFSMKGRKGTVRTHDLDADPVYVNWDEKSGSDDSMSWSRSSLTKIEIGDTVTISQEEFDAFKKKVQEKALDMVDKGNWCRDGVVGALKELGIEEEWPADPGKGHIAFCGDGGYLRSFIRGSGYWEPSERSISFFGSGGTKLQSRKEWSWTDVVQLFQKAGYHPEDLRIVKLGE